MPIKAILFDLDGTLLDTLDDLTDSVNHALASLGFPLHTKGDICSFLGNGVKNLILRSLPQNATDEDFQNCLTLYKEHYEMNKTNKTKPYDGILPAISALKSQGYKLAIVSNKHDDAVQGLFKMFFSKYTDFALGNTDHLPKKPAPDMVYLALDKLGISHSEAVFVGDSEVDVTTAKNAGIPCISVTWGFRSEKQLIENGANIIIHNPNKLPDAVSKL